MALQYANEKLRVTCDKEFYRKPIRLLRVDISHLHQECASDETNIQLDFLTGLSKGDNIETFRTLCLKTAKI
ncbi:hypothetical protein U27_03381 [Candidatus Vecturithrix granuli]|uniref:Uncharacterized protein n=1 Tax=Vecturithrix granuli TaxID=1499967 RepID=A0A081BVR4_VECG1|nr:hypothetical protein U27_03381 [Candidatus Vecturithrix granuli]